MSRICAPLDAEVAAFRSRSLAGMACLHLWLDATYLRVREGAQVVSMAALVATGVADTGGRRVPGLELPPATTRAAPGPGSPARPSSAACAASGSSSATIKRAS